MDLGVIIIYLYWLISSKYVPHQFKMLIEETEGVDIWEFCEPNSDLKLKATNVNKTKNHKNL